MRDSVVDVDIAALEIRRRAHSRTQSVKPPDLAPDQLTNNHTHLLRDPGDAVR
jgi:hypothetical protein